MARQTVTRKTTATKISFKKPKASNATKPEKKKKTGITK